MSTYTHAPILGPLCLLVLGLTLAAPANARQYTEGVSRADSLVSSWVESEKVPGAVLLISRDGRTLIEKAYGWAHLYDHLADGRYDAQSGDAPPQDLSRLADPPPMTPETAFDLASVTKVMATTFAVMDLLDRAALDLDAPLHTYLTDFLGGDRDQVTIRDLLTHRGGLQQWRPVYYHAADAQDAYEYVRDLPLGWPVGSVRRYSDLGFMLLGRVVEDVTGRRLDAYLQERFYGPLGLSATGFRPRRCAPPVPLPRLPTATRTSTGWCTIRISDT